MITKELIIMLFTILVSNLLDINLKSFYLNLKITKKTYQITLNIDFVDRGKGHL